jgi:hypothetical protein
MMVQDEVQHPCCVPETMIVEDDDDDFDPDTNTIQNDVDTTTTKQKTAKEWETFFSTCPGEENEQIEVVQSRHFRAFSFNGMVSLRILTLFLHTDICDSGRARSGQTMGNMSYFTPSDLSADIEEQGLHQVAYEPNRFNGEIVVYCYEATVIEESSADQASDENGGDLDPLAYNSKKVWSFVPDAKKNDNVALANAGMLSLAGAIELHNLVEDANWSVIEVGGTTQDEKRLVENRLAYFIVLEALKKMETMTYKEILNRLRLRSHSSQNGATAENPEDEDQNSPLVFGETQALLQQLSEVRLTVLDGMHRILYALCVLSATVPDQSRALANEYWKPPSSRDKCWQELDQPSSLKCIGLAEKVAGPPFTSTRCALDRDAVAVLRAFSTKGQQNGKNARARSVANSMIDAIHYTCTKGKPKILIMEDELLYDHGCNSVVEFLKSSSRLVSEGLLEDDNRPTCCIWKQSRQESKKKFADALHKSQTFRNDFLCAPLLEGDAQYRRPLLAMLALARRFIFDRPSKAGFIRLLTQHGQASPPSPPGPSILWHHHHETSDWHETFSKQVAQILLGPQAMLAREIADGWWCDEQAILWATEAGGVKELPMSRRRQVQTCRRLDMCIAYHVGAEMVKILSKYGLRDDKSKILNDLERLTEPANAEEEKKKLAPNTHLVFHIIHALLCAGKLETKPLRPIQFATQCISRPHKYLYRGNTRLEDFVPQFRLQLATDNIEPSLTLTEVATMILSNADNPEDPELPLPSTTEIFQIYKKEAFKRGEEETWRSARKGAQSALFASRRLTEHTMTEEKVVQVDLNLKQVPAKNPAASKRLAEPAAKAEQVAQDITGELHDLNDARYKKTSIAAEAAALVEVAQAAPGAAQQNCWVRFRAAKVLQVDLNLKQVPAKNPAASKRLAEPAAKAEQVAQDTAGGLQYLNDARYKKTSIAAEAAALVEVAQAVPGAAQQTSGTYKAAKSPQDAGAVVDGQALEAVKASGVTGASAAEAPGIHKITENLGDLHQDTTRPTAPVEAAKTRTQAVDATQELEIAQLEKEIEALTAEDAKAGRDGKAPQVTQDPAAEAALVPDITEAPAAADSAEAPRHSSTAAAEAAKTRTVEATTVVQAVEAVAKGGHAAEATSAPEIAQAEAEDLVNAQAEKGEAPAPETESKMCKKDEVAQRAPVAAATHKRHREDMSMEEERRPVHARLSEPKNTADCLEMWKTLLTKMLPNREGQAVEDDARVADFNEHMEASRASFRQDGHHDLVTSFQEGARTNTMSSLLVSSDTREEDSTSFPGNAECSEEAPDDLSMVVSAPDFVAAEGWAGDPVVGLNRGPGVDPAKKREIRETYMLNVVAGNQPNSDEWLPALPPYRQFFGQTQCQVSQLRSTGQGSMFDQPKSRHSNHVPLPLLPQAGKKDQMKRQQAEVSTRKRGALLEASASDTSMKHSGFDQGTSSVGGSAGNMDAGGPSIDSRRLPSAVKSPSKLAPRIQWKPCTQNNTPDHSAINSFDFSDWKEEANISKPSLFTTPTSRRFSNLTIKKAKKDTPETITIDDGSETEPGPVRSCFGVETSTHCTQLFRCPSYVLFDAFIYTALPTCEGRLSSSSLRRRFSRGKGR